MADAAEAGSAHLGVGGDPAPDAVDHHGPDPEGVRRLPGDWPVGGDLEGNREGY